MNKIFIISGPTASGKSALALDFANFRDISIINADSLQIYEGLPILSSQPSSAEQKQVKHYLYSDLKPQESSSVGLWLKLAKLAIEESWQQNKLPLIVGGSGMYISKLVDGISEIPEIDEEIRKLSRDFFEEIGVEEFRNNLIELGEEKDKIIKLDKQRLIRSYEVFKQTGKTISWWQNQPNKKLFDDKIFTHINLNPNREELYKNCNLRFEMMLENGAVEEVENFLNKFMNENLPITKTLGFVEIVDFLNGRISYEEVVKIASQKTRNYAKRQLTWFRHQLPDKRVFENKREALGYLKGF
jgi:tRNA dimethylallyltransferase